MTTPMQDAVAAVTLLREGNKQGASRVLVEAEARHGANRMLGSLTGLAVAVLDTMDEADGDRVLQMVGWWAAHQAGGDSSPATLEGVTTYNVVSNGRTVLTTEDRDRAVAEMKEVAAAERRPASVYAEGDAWPLATAAPCPHCKDGLMSMGVG